MQWYTLYIHKCICIIKHNFDTTQTGSTVDQKKYTNFVPFNLSSYQAVSYRGNTRTSISFDGGP